MSSKPKKLSAMDLLVKSDAFKPALSQASARSRSAVANLRDGTPVEIPPEACRPWMLADRPADETTHQADLVKSFQSRGIGQLQPIVVREVKDADTPEIEYEVICGRVRWLAAKELGIPVQAIVRELTDQEAYTVMSAENRQRKNLSDFAKAKSYQKALNLGVFATAQELAEAEGLTKSRLSQYLGFAELPETVARSFASIAKIPYRLGYELNKACKAMGEDAIIPLVPKIESGELSRDEIQQMQTRKVDASALPAGMLPEQGQVPAKQAKTPSTLADVGLPQQAEVEAGTRPKGESPVSRKLDEPQFKKSFVSSSGRTLFTYNQASRGWLIRIHPEVSMAMDEALMLKFGQWLEAYLESADASRPD